MIMIFLFNKSKKLIAVKENVSVFICEKLSSLNYDVKNFHQRFSKMKGKMKSKSNYNCRTDETEKVIIFYKKTENKKKQKTNESDEITERNRTMKNSNSRN